MPRVVFKYPLNVAVQTVSMPVGAKPLTVGPQAGVVLWCEVDPDAALEPRLVKVVGTGWPFDSDGFRYVGTAQMPNGLVWHVYIEEPRDA